MTKESIQSAKPAIPESLPEAPVFQLCAAQAVWLARPIHKEQLPNVLIADRVSFPQVQTVS